MSHGSGEVIAWVVIGVALVFALILWIERRPGRVVIDEPVVGDATRHAHDIAQRAQVQPREGEVMADRFTHGWDGERHKGERMGTIWHKNGSGDVTLSSSFDDLHPVHRCDILQDLIYLLEKEYKHCFEELSGPLSMKGAARD